jgi:hypothetical protein
MLQASVQISGSDEKNTGTIYEQTTLPNAFYFKQNTNMDVPKYKIRFSSWTIERHQTKKKQVNTKSKGKLRNTIKTSFA